MRNIDFKNRKVIRRDIPLQIEVFGANICPLGNSDKRRILPMLQFADGGSWKLVDSRVGRGSYPDGFQSV